MSIMQRRKGANGEREFINMLRDDFGIEATRNLDQTREGGADIVGVGEWAIEVKRAKEPKINTWWAQACEQAEKINKIPALAYRLDHQAWRVIFPLRAIPGFEEQPLLMMLEAGFYEFAAIMREFKK